MINDNKFNEGYLVSKISDLRSILYPGTSHHPKPFYEIEYPIACHERYTIPVRIIEYSKKSKPTGFLFQPNWAVAEAGG